MLLFLILTHLRSYEMKAKQNTQPISQL